MKRLNSPNLEARATVLVLGIGNTLRQDDGLGVRAVERLNDAYVLPDRACALDGGTLGLDLLDRVEGAQELLVIDAIESGGAPGSLVRLEGEQILCAMRVKMSLHEAGLHELLGACALRGTLPVRRVLWGVTPASVGWGIELSHIADKAVDEVVARVAGGLRGWGVDLQPRQPAHRAAP